MSSIPVIDIRPYLDGTDKQGVADAVGKACEEIGFFMIQGHGIPLDLMKQVQSEATKFFDLTLDIKRRTTAPFGLGYMGEGTENVAATLKEESKVQDTKESLNLTLPVRDGVWPRNSPDLVDACRTYYESVETLAARLMRLFALALRLDETFFDDKVDRPYTTLRMLNYPAQVPGAANPETTRNAEHTDYGTLTILWSPDSRGLQARSRRGEWVDVVAPVDRFIINIGDLMMNWTNDRWISTLHRVIPHADTVGTRRMSLPFFHNPNPDAMIECIPSCFDNASNPSKYQPILAKSHLEMKVSKALGKEEKME
uniref:Fe2OG dioxygenase domain-containing protein n=1 Tax=Corethron hystrix TaxID=216773 RepID=A0A7S1FXQ8_9STRA|mmetsp:Transcript_40329/g.94763  ORF Transcript_40329/g.94763 Transcript_40329/m.94763 type:complete len:312 (+) Transcript_40329:188-1123(+)|eukprot:CAMPEP_0113297582 /NCGR_PEP_ID=MMETSP0010_2-20120614/379_1 /TAXON_ID=216773 ORGANISM="Corethron hystrix, Strain 308" /NCGR_SAMPLE_ID=MMETSP0010_2 /ASSEMBLY_ACC=CAM_ASM_000155 /LENGTH=311 /DNA_ID=CAMNT_0000150485 /DNA_START=126 /DNA_END=1061 /DNA_ORIENTATION=+ /assembly_acc=CAM_ASM_000155